MSEENELPEGWIWTTIGEVADTTSGGTPSRNQPEYYSGAIPWVKSGELRDNIVTNVEEFITEEGLNNSNTKILQQGTILIAMYGITAGRTAILGLNAAINQAICAIIPSAAESLDAKYITYWLQHQRQVLIDQSSGGAQPNISQGIVRALLFPLPPINEQRRIVEFIEEQFSRLSTVIESLQKNLVKLQYSRDAIIESAVEGELTKSWRTEHPATESGAEFLERILTERRAKWEVQKLALMEAKGMIIWDDKWKDEYKEPLPPDMTNLSSLPREWFWATVNQLGDVTEQVVLTGPFGSNLGKEDFIDSGVPVLTIGCLTEQGLSLKKALYVSEEKADELKRYRVKAGDILFSRMASVGRADVVPDHMDGFIFNYHLMRLRLASNAINPNYFITYIRGSQTIVNYIKDVNQGVTRDGINTDQLLALPVSVPSQAEQEQIVVEVERHLSNIGYLESTIEVNLKRIEQTRQSILKKAFAGRLVPQDPNDEPASKLLERIREEREKREQEKQLRKKEAFMDNADNVRKKKIDKEPLPLCEVLAEIGKPLSPHDLFRRARLEANNIEHVDKFYDELRAEVDKRIRVLRPNNAQVLLEAMSE